MPVKLAEQPC